ncbi:hypothetical protein [Streptomyces sp. NPDC050504]|uniref:hypothetical protein n=1 Tax=Streptomyces sp. NPDC050504 TaxID=3365618 RepID=UPI0037957C9F
MKIPSVTETTASHPRRGDLVDKSVPSGACVPVPVLLVLVLVLVAEAMFPIP